MKRVLAFVVVVACLMYAVEHSDWWRHRYEAYIPHQQCLAVKPAAECEALRP